jgi:predicted RNase H-like HicB family nuclease
MTAAAVVTSKSQLSSKRFMARLRGKLEQVNGELGQDWQIKKLIEAIDRRLARIRAEQEADLRYTVVFEKRPDEFCWGARIIELPDTVQVIGNTLEEAAVRIARRISKHFGQEKLR